jgi:hypothetical protein
MNQPELQTQHRSNSHPSSGDGKILQAPAVRSLKIEADGDFWRGKIKPKLRLMGRWLERAGFKPGGRAQVLCISPGVLELRSTEALMLSETSQTPGHLEPRREAVAARETYRAEPAVSTLQTIRPIDLTRRTPDRFAFCGPHFYNSSPRTRALRTYWQNCAHCGKALGYFSTCEEAQANRGDCVPASPEIMPA